MRHRAIPAPARRRSERRPLIVFVAAAIAAALGGLGWWSAHETLMPPELDRRLHSLSYSFAAPDEQYLEGEAAEARLETVSRDLEMLAGTTHAIRLYASSGIYRHVPAIARERGLGVIAGAWVGRDEEFSKAELDAVIDLANRNSNVQSIVVGNETILRRELDAEELAAYVQYVRQRVEVPVTTGETWDIWLANPELVRSVDYVAAHILPYWEGMPADHVLEYTFQRYDELREAYPGKRIVIAEFGWPSRGMNYLSAMPGPLLQARIVREFLGEAHRREVPYNVIEAVDQPWKTNEGSVGLYWGLFDASRTPKFSLQGEVQESHYASRAALAIAFGFAATLLMYAFHWRPPTFAEVFAVGVAAQALGSGVAMAALYPLENYLNAGSAIAWGLGMVLMAPLTLMTLVRVQEVADVTVGRKPKRLLRGPIEPPPGWRAPKVSIQVPAYRESPAMLAHTLDALAALDYPDFEVLAIVNNTPEEDLWRPIAEHCERLGERFKFVFLPKVEGFKAGALNAAMAAVSPDAEVLALIDADYVVDPHWLRDLVPAFADPRIAMVQAPQDHRDGADSPLKTVMNSEYAGFFDIGMVQRNEDDAIITHGTMLLVRRRAFDEVGGWDSSTITEDTELGLRILRAGHQALYTNRRYGWGMLPDSFRAFKTQRDRWAYGAVQIMRKHWRAMLPRDRSLDSAQKYQFLTGWSFWIADAFGVLAACLNLFWVPMILFVGVLIPMLPFTVPILAMFVVNLLHCALLYSVRVKLPGIRVVGAALAAMSLQMTVARAIGKGFLKGNLPFLRTDKGGVGKLRRPSRQASVVRTETLLGVGLALGALALHLTNDLEMIEIDVFAATLLVQSLPFLSVPAMAALEWWSERRTRLSEALPVPAAGTAMDLASTARIGAGFTIQKGDLR